MRASVAGRTERWLRFLATGMTVLEALTMSTSGAVLENRVGSKILGEARVVRVFLPASYEGAEGRRYPVLYVHDGQNVFSTAGSGVAFGWGNWEVDLTVERLAAEGRMREAIVVAVDNTARRYEEYRGPAYPYTEDELKAFRRRPAAVGDDGPYRRYARFLVEELKPEIDRGFRTLTGPVDTAVMGSSMGGICSVVLAWDYPAVFGGAASLSGAFQVERRFFLDRVLRGYASEVKPVRLYLDSGTVDFGGGDDGRSNTVSVVEQLRRIGWNDGVNLEHQVEEKLLTVEEGRGLGLAEDKQREATRSHHNELYWRRRVWRALVFLFPAGGK